MWILSLLFALIGSATNLFFSLRYPSVAITPIIALVLVHPIGRSWDTLLRYEGDPTETFEDGLLNRRSTSDDIQYPRRSKRQRFRLWLAQGRWNEKEHACVYISSNVSFGFAMATDVCLYVKFDPAKPTNSLLGHCRANKILPPRSVDSLSATTDNLDPNSGIRICRAHTSLFSSTS